MSDFEWQLLNDFNHFVKIINYRPVAAVPVFPQDKMTHTYSELARQLQKYSYFLSQVLWTFVFNQAATEQRHPSLSSKLCSFFRSSLINPGPVFLVSGSVYIVFLDKCQPMTFFEVIYSLHKTKAAPVFV